MEAVEALLRFALGILFVVGGSLRLAGETLPVEPLAQAGIRHLLVIATGIVDVAGGLGLLFWLAWPIVGAFWPSFG